MTQDNKPLSKRANSFKHGQTKTKVYRAWGRIKGKCYNKNYTEFYLYGGRGIKMCDRWLNSFENFLADVGLPPTDKHTIDRFPNVNGDYEPSNVRWATQKEQQGNRRNNRWIEYNGERMILSEWGRRIGMMPNELCQKLKTKTFDQLYSLYLKSKENIEP